MKFNHIYIHTEIIITGKNIYGTLPKYILELTCPPTPTTIQLKFDDDTPDTPDLQITGTVHWGKKL